MSSDEIDFTLICQVLQLNKIYSSFRILSNTTEYYNCIESSSFTILNRKYSRVQLFIHLKIDKQQRKIPSAIIPCIELNKTADSKRSLKHKLTTCQIQTNVIGQKKAYALWVISIFNRGRFIEKTYN